MYEKRRKSTMDMAKTYNPSEFEKEIYEEWEKKGYFKAEVDSNKLPFTIVIPPINIRIYAVPLTVNLRLPLLYSEQQLQSDLQYPLLVRSSHHRFALFDFVRTSTFFFTVFIT